METLRALIRGDLPPVGSPITYFDSDRRAALPTFSGYCCHWVDSGTSALALAFLSAKSLRGEVASPEVIVPGYCCPDLLSAAHFAGFTPVIIDIEVDDPALNQQALKQVITENTVAIVAINFLGVTENIKMFEQLKLEYPRVFVVEDNAQWFPGEGELNLLFGDFVAFSFGRGKPVSLLGGGLLLVRSALPPAVVSSVKPQQSVGGFSSLELTLKYFAYNRLLKPFWYQFLSRNPFVSLGQTRYDSLRGIESLDSMRRALLLTNAELYASSNNSIDLQYDQLFSAIGFQNTLTSLGTNRRRRLLRYPILFSSVEEKNRVFPRLVKLGLGATEMYRKALPQIDGVENISVMDDLTNAVSFAARFISLPVHAEVTPKHLQLLKGAFSE